MLLMHMTMTTPISIAVILLYLSVMITLTKTTVPEILVPPENQTVVAGTKAVFTCIVKGDQIDFFVNEERADMENVKSKGFSLTKMISNNNGDNKFLSLEAKGDESNNKTRIKCRAMAGQSQPVYSEVLLLIQGPLDPVVDLSCCFINSSAAISWIPPFTLHNTTINGYNISVTSYGKEIAKSFTSHTGYLLTLSNKTNSFNVTVAAYNGLNGAIAEISAHSCSEAVPSSSVFNGSNSDDTSEPHDSPVTTEPEKITTIEILIPPENQTVVTGSMAVFTCTVKGGEIDFYVNGTRADEEEVKSKGFIQSTVKSNGDTKYRSLEAKGDESNNMTEIACRLMNISKNYTSYSYEVFLLIQGSLNPVANLTCRFINSFAVNVSWIPPFTLPNTIINGYNISVTTYGEEIAKSFTPYTQYLFTEKSEFFIVRVAAYNELNGAIEEISAQSCSEIAPCSDSERVHHNIISSKSVIAIFCIISAVFGMILGVVVTKKADCIMRKKKLKAFLDKILDLLMMVTSMKNKEVPKKRTKNKTGR